jgi:hypothetical protein
MKSKTKNMSKRKTTTNENKLKKLISSNDPILNALLVERIVMIMNITEEDIHKNFAEWEKCIIHPSLYHQLNKNIKESLCN